MWRFILLFSISLYGIDLSKAIEKLEHKQNYQEALLLYPKLISNQDKNSLDRVIYINNMAEAYKKSGEYQKSIQTHKKALSLKLRTFSSQHKSISISYNNLGEVYRTIKDYKNAYQNYMYSLEIREKYSNNSKLKSNIYANLGSFYHEIGDYENASIFHKKALAIRENIGYRLCISYNNIAKTYQKQYKSKEALNLYNKAFSFSKTSKTKTEIYINIAQTKLDLNLSKEAIIFIDKAYNSWRYNIEQKAIIYETKAKIYQKTLDYNQSLFYYHKAKKIREDIFGIDNINTGKIYYGLSLVYAKLKDYNRSITYNIKAYDVFVQNRDTNYLILTSKQKKQYNKHYNTLSILINLFDMSLMNASKTNLMENFDRWINYKGNISNRENRISILYQNLKELKENIEKLKQNRIYLSTLYQTYPSSKQTDLNIIKLQKEIIKREIKYNSMDLVFRNLLSLRHITHRDISKHLKKNQIYIDFVRAKNNYYIWILDYKNSIKFKKITNADTIILDNKIKLFRDINNQMTKKKKDILDLHKQSNNALNEIYNILNKHIDFQTKSMIISSDGILNLLPFGALYFDNRYLIQQSNILYIPCAKDFVSAFFKYNSNNSKAKDIVVFGNPDYDKPFKTSNTRGGYKIGYRMIDLKSYFHTLEGTIKEISFLKKQYKNAIIYQDKNATVENLLSIVNPRILHIATHGFYIPNSNSNHLQETGLALTGANNARKTTDTRGLVTALKISTMELFKTELVVLSACQIGVTKIELSEAIAGLSKSFIQAGAKNVMMSLWNVDDKETANLMKKFYQKIQKNKSFTQSLREAKLSKIHLHPYYWSAFIMNGI